MSDTLFIYDTVTHLDTLKDTILVASLALNSIKDTAQKINWTDYATFIAAIGTFVLFVLSYFKELKFHKLNTIAEQDKYKFQKAHDKTVQISESIVNDLNEVLMEIIDYRRLLYQNSSKDELSEKIILYKQRIDEYIRSLRNQALGARLYVEQTVLSQIIKLTGELNAFYFLNIGERNEPNIQSDLDVEINTVIEKLKQVINGKTS
jgi:hypothetical protein